MRSPTEIDVCARGKVTRWRHIGSGVNNPEGNLGRRQLVVPWIQGTYFEETVDVVDTMGTVDIGVLVNVDLSQVYQQTLSPYHHSLHGHDLYLHLHARLGYLHRSRVQKASPRS
ncbi:hypothetical protein J6590_068677 [Homalodisca vitripennis]|nr:hypothetical protein J6590_068677 [Homalodisca vitripennis]